MCCSKFFLPILLTFLLFQNLVVFGEQKLYHECLSSENYTSSDPYETQLKELLSYISYETPSTGFGLGSKGEGKTRIYGLALCRGDVSTTNCMTCTAQASNEIRKYCPKTKAAAIWYETCFLKYSRENFYGQIDYKNWYFLDSHENMSDPKLYGQRGQELINQLIEDAVVNPKMYASGKLEPRGLQTLYGLVQCSRDLLALDCKKCLSDTASWLEKCCLGKKGARMYSGTCNIRFELYQFFKT